MALSLAAVDRAFSEVAHDTKTPLMAIGGFAGQVSRIMDATDPNQKKRHIVVEQTAQLESLVKAMPDFGAPSQFVRSITNLNHLEGRGCMDL